MRGGEWKWRARERNKQRKCKTIRAAVVFGFHRHAGNANEGVTVAQISIYDTYTCINTYGPLK